MGGGLTSFYRKEGKMTCPNESVGLKPSEVFNASQLDRNPWEHHRQCL